MISIRGAADLELAGQSWPTSSTGRNNSPFFSKNSPEPSGVHRSRNAWYRRRASRPAPWRRQLVSSGVGASTTARISSFPIERLLELVVALAPVQVRRNQRVDVGVDGEVAGPCRSPPRPRGSARDDDDERANRVQALTIETTILVSTSFLSNVTELAENARCLAEFHGPI